jgi:Transcription factor WhiB
VISDSEPWARAVYGRCAVAAACLADALADLTLAGIWAGPSSRDRRRLRRQVAYG